MGAVADDPVVPQGAGHRQRTRPRERGRDSPEVEEYIASAPPETRQQLERIRRAIRSVVPDADERISYRMPGYSYSGYPLKGMFVWFGLQRNHVGLYLRPPTVADHRRELKRFTTTKSAVHLPLDDAIPTVLVQRLVRASLRIMREGKGRPAQKRGSSYSPVHRNALRRR